MNCNKVVEMIGKIVSNENISEFEQIAQIKNYINGSVKNSSVGVNPDELLALQKMQIKIVGMLMKDAVSWEPTGFPQVVHALESMAKQVAELDVASFIEDN